MSSFRSDSVELAAAKESVRQREFRRAAFGVQAGSDAVWDLLLDLFIANEENIEVSLTCIGLAGNVPSTTALRWIRKLAVGGYLTRMPDKSDGRRTIVELTPETITKMRSLLGGRRDNTS